MPLKPQWADKIEAERKRIRARMRPYLAKLARVREQKNNRKKEPDNAE